MATRSDRPQPQAAWFIRPNGFDAAPTIHGMRHTRRVLIHATAIAEALGLEPWQREAIELAACWHDIGRTHDGVDYYHGAKSAGKVVALGLHEGVDRLVYETALFAVTQHCVDERRAKDEACRLRYFVDDGEGEWVPRYADAADVMPVFLVLKDADGLDRVRLGGVDMSYMRTDPARGMEARAWELLAEIPEIR
jgi:hypothetical protein